MSSAVDAESLLQTLQQDIVVDGAPKAAVRSSRTKAPRYPRSTARNSSDKTWRTAVDLGVPQVLIRWLHSFMSNRQQRVKIGEVVSEWASPNGGMPQGTWLGVYIFLTLINDLKSEINLHKFVDDCTLSEIIPRFGSSPMQHEVDELNDWSKANHMNINTNKTKEMIIGNIKKEFPPSLRLNDNEIERVSVYKLHAMLLTTRPTAPTMIDGVIFHMNEMIL